MLHGNKMFWAVLAIVSLVFLPACGGGGGGGNKDNVDTTVAVAGMWVGELTDESGSDERWVERVTFLGDDQWKLEVDGTDFHGNSNGESWSEQFSTKELVAWLDEQDSYLDDGEDEPKKPRLEAQIQHLPT